MFNFWIGRHQEARDSLGRGINQYGTHSWPEIINWTRGKIYFASVTLYWFNLSSIWHSATSPLTFVSMNIQLPTVLILGHSFVKRLKRDLLMAFALSNRADAEFNFIEYCPCLLHRVGGTRKSSVTAQQFIISIFTSWAIYFDHKKAFWWASCFRLCIS